MNLPFGLYKMALPNFGILKTLINDQLGNKIKSVISILQKIDIKFPLRLTFSRKLEI